MSDALRRRRQQLWEALTKIDAELAATAGERETSWDDGLSGTLNAPQFFTLLDARSRILFVNRLPPGRPDPIGRSVLDFVPDDRRHALGNAIARALHLGHPQYFEGEGEGPAGETSWYSTWVVPMTGPARTILAVISADVTQARRVEQALASEKSLLESLVASAPDSVLVVGRDHRVQFINRTLHPITKADVIGHTAESFVVEQHRKRVHQAIEHVFQTGAATAYDTLLQAPDGPRWYSVRVGPVLEAGRVTRVSMVATDITEQRAQSRLQAEQQAALQQSEERFRTLVEYAPEAMVIFDVDTGRFVDVNANACELFDMDRETLLGCGPLEVSPERQPDGSDSRQAAADWIARALEGEHPVVEWCHQDRSGRAIPCEVRLVRLPHDGRRWVRGSIIDITERKRADDERARLTAELAQAQKLQAIGQLTGGVAHDFNNLLTVIMSSLELIELRPEEVESVLAHTRQALAASQRAAALTAQLLAFARRQPLRPRAVNLNELLETSKTLLQRALGEGVEIVTAAAPDLWPCETDPVRLENAILNLALNARDAMPEGGRLVIETANLHLDDDTTYPGVPPGDYVTLSATDDGTGMSAAVARHAFEPFFTTKETGRGSGLGLSMVYGFVRQSGGQVQIDSRPGAGTTVRMLLPRSAASAEALEQHSAPATTPPGRGERVLLVEDDEAVLSLVRRTLEGLGYEVAQAGDAAGALAALEGASEDDPGVRAVLTDVVLPGGRTGADLAREIDDRWPGLPVLYMSGYSADAVAADGRLVPPRPLLEKPFTRQRLAAAVRDALDEAAPHD